MKITFTFIQKPGDAQIESMTLRAEGGDVLSALGKAQLFVESVTTIPVSRITIDLDAPQS